MRTTALLTSFLLLGCPGKDDSAVDSPPGESGDADTDTDADSDSDSDSDSDTDLDWGDHCAESDAFEPVYDQVIARWTAQDAAAPWPAEPLVFVGSSSVRRWEDFAWTFRGQNPLQRGFGGAQLGEVAQRAKDLVTRHEPRAVLVFAGTNDVAAGVAPEVVAERLRCLRQRVGEDMGQATDLLFVGITPTPARWESWDRSAAVNAAVEAFAEQDERVHYIDTPGAFLATGEPPDSALFVDDQLHLSEAGYALWAEQLVPAVEAVTSERSPPAHEVLASGTRVLIDLGPSNKEDGELSPSPDWLGQHWNNWHALEGGVPVLPGEHLDDLVDSAGGPTGIDLIVAGGFGANGRSDGGLLWPDPKLLGDLAVGSATGDYFYSDGEDLPGALFLRGLDPDGRYTLQLFAAREEQERRVTSYTVRGAGSTTRQLQTSGPDAGCEGAYANDCNVVGFTGLQPDAWGQIHVDVDIAEGRYAYLSLLVLVVE
jgi:lysophospholipase L1-like esterase